jgi:hypothetical protein
LVTTLPFAAVPYMALLAYYGGFLILFFIVWTVLKNKFTYQKKA